MLVSPTIRKSACPHDCPSACALEVTVLPDNRIGRIAGSSENPTRLAWSARRSRAMPSAFITPTG